MLERIGEIINLPLELFGVLDGIGLIGIGWYFLLPPSN
jgi:hypothetical protein